MVLLSFRSYFPKNGKARRRLQTSLNANAPCTYLYLDADPPTQFAVVSRYTRIREIPGPELICMWAVGQ